MSDKHDGPDHPLERLIFFSDAVFAIAITLLIIELHPPHLHYHSEPREYLVALLQMFGSFFAFFCSFFVIGAFWAGHHRAFAMAGHYSEALLMPNLFVLCAVVFLPFSTAFMGANMGGLVPTAFYNVTLVVIGLLNVLLVRKVTSPPVVRHDVPHERIAYVRARGWAVVLGATTALACTFIDPRFSQIALISIGPWSALLRTRTARRLARLEA